MFEIAVFLITAAADPHKGKITFSKTWSPPCQKAVSIAGQAACQADAGFPPNSISADIVTRQYF